MKAQSATPAARAVYIPKARLIDPSTGRDEIASLYIDEKGFIAPVPTRFPPKSRLTVIEQEGITVTPGLCDIHVHFRDPGLTETEDLLSGACAAANGGFTRVVTMPNTQPAIDTPELLRRQTQATVPVTILPAACATLERQGRLAADIERLASAGASAFTDDGGMIADPDIMRAVMMRAKQRSKCVMDHAVKPEIALSGVIRACKTASDNELPIFPPEAEVEAVRADIALCRATGCALHIQHLSCAASLELIREARKEGLPVTAEVTPHHLALAAEDIPGDDANYKMNPPLGTRVDVEALRQGVLDGSISAFATDHAPHARLAKLKGFRLAPFGVIGLETAVGITWSLMVLELGMKPLAWAAAWITEPAKVIGVRPPTLEIGQPAELAIFDFETQWVVNPDQFVSKSRNTPFTGRTLTGQALYTYRKGRLRAAVRG